MDKRIPLRPPADRPRTRVAVYTGGERVRLTPKESKFVAEYLVDFNQTRAALAAGWSPLVAGSIGSQLIRRPAILAEINRQQVLNREHLQLQREDLMQMWYDLATADPRELIPVRVRCCRCCWGIGHQYQFTDGELEQLYAKHRYQHQKTPGGPPVMDEKGGGGFDQTRLPHSIENGQDHNCPECHGIGVEVRFPIDLDKVSRSARLLIGGIKVDRYGGVDIKFNDRLRAIEKLEEYLGFIRPKKPVAVMDFDELDDGVIDALLREAKVRGLIRDDELALTDITPPKGE